MNTKQHNIKDNISFEAEHFNYPSLGCSHRNHAGIVRREIFNDFGPSCNFNTLTGDELLLQRQADKLGIRHAASHPVLPLNTRCNRVELTPQDCVTGDIRAKNTTRRFFTMKVKKFKEGKTVILPARMQELEHIQVTLHAAFMERQEGRESDFSDARSMMDTWFLDILKQYDPIAHSNMQWNNSKYTGGLLSAVTTDKGGGHLIAASGENFSSISVLKVLEQYKGIMHTIPQCEVSTSSPIYGVNSQTVQGKVYVSAKMDRECVLYNIKDSSKRTKLRAVTNTTLPEDAEHLFQAITISPYIPGECVVCLSDGSCHLWADDSLEQVTPPSEPRFRVPDSWHHVQYGAHPRHIVTCDLTQLQLHDLRVHDSEGVDLFSLPSPLFHPWERLRAVARHPMSDFYTLLASDFMLMLVDERFPKHPVLKWDHLLMSPAQYMTSLPAGSVLSASLDSSEALPVFVGSQYPPELHCFWLNQQAAGTPAMVGKPYRAARPRDISQWPGFASQCTNSRLLLERLNVSLAGIAALPTDNGHTIYQMDSQGEIFHQTFTRVDSLDGEQTFAVGLGSHELRPDPVAECRGQQWVESWDSQMKQMLRDITLKRDLRNALYGFLHYREPLEGCPMCKPAVAHTLSHAPSPQSQRLCGTCLCSGRTAQTLLNTTQDEVPRSDGNQEPTNLYSVENLSQKSALSRLLLKHWERDDNIDHILLDWDREVYEKMQKKKARRAGAAAGADNSEQPSLLTQILGLPASTFTEPDPGAEDPGGQHSEPSEVIEGEASSQESVFKSPRSRSHSKKRHKERRRRGSETCSESSLLDQTNQAQGTAVSGMEEGMLFATPLPREKTGERSRLVSADTLSIVSGTSGDNEDVDLHTNLTRGIENMLKDDEQTHDILSTSSSKREQRKHSQAEYDSAASHSLFSSQESVSSRRSKKKKKHKNADKSPSKRSYSSLPSVSSKLSEVAFPVMSSQLSVGLMSNRLSQTMTSLRKDSPSKVKKSANKTGYSMFT